MGRVRKTETVAARDFGVASAPLSGMITDFVGRWERDRPRSTGHDHHVSNVRAVEWLAAESGLSEKQIREVTSGKHQTISLGVADALVAAVGCPEAFHDGTLQVIEPTPS